MLCLEQVKKVIMDNLEANNFQPASKFYSTEFGKILIGIIKCYWLILKNKNSVPSNDENKIRDIFLSKEYLKNRKIKNQLNLLEYRFDREISEDHSNGRIDIRIIAKNDFEIDEAYYTIECKRLDNQNLLGETGLNAKYVKEGIKRFTIDQYSAYYGVNGMIGFVIEKMNIDNNINNINQLLENQSPQITTIKKLQFIRLIEKFKHSYCSNHENINKKNITLYHLMFDLSENLVVQNSH